MHLNQNFVFVCKMGFYALFIVLCIYIGYDIIIDQITSITWNNGGNVMSRKSARESAMKLLYQIELGGSSSEEAIESFYENYEGKELTSEDKEYINVCVKGTAESVKNIDEQISKHTKEWKINRIAKVELSIMRLAIFEMINRKDIPKSVVVNEAIELAKKFGGENSSSFINGVLGNIIK
jgi:N utilization substance protein B